MKNVKVKATVTILLAAAFFLTAASFLTAQEGEQQEASQFVLMEDLIGYQVVDENEEILGDLSDLVVLEDGSIPYLLVRFTPFIYDYEFGQQLHLVPVEMAQVDRAQAHILLARVEAEDLSLSPPIRGDEMIDVTEEYDLRFQEWWLAEPRYNYGVDIEAGPGVTEQDLQELGAPGGTGPATLVSVLNDYDIISSEGEEIGEVEGVLVNLDSGRVEYLGLGNSSGFLGLGEQIYPIPFGRIELDTEEDSVSINVTEETLEEAPGFDETEAWVETPASEWTGRVEEFWGGR